jgi:hypothetical protein
MCWCSNQLSHPDNPLGHPDNPLGQARILLLLDLIRAPAHKAGDSGSNPGPGENFSLKLTTQDLLEGYSEN